jgi:hypothetical protein
VRVVGTDSCANEPYKCALAAHSLGVFFLHTILIPTAMR